MDALEKIRLALKAAKLAGAGAPAKAVRTGHRGLWVGTVKLKVAKAKTGEEAVAILKAAGIVTKGGKLSRHYS